MLQKNLLALSLFLSLCLVMVLFITSCSPTSSWPVDVPETDIVFQSVMYFPFELNFIQADGSDHQMLNLSENFAKPDWSSDGTLLYGLSNYAGQAKYEDLGYPAYWDVKNGRFQRCSDNLPNYFQIEGYRDAGSQLEVILSNTTEILLFDLRTCQEIQRFVDFNDRRGEAMIAGFSYFQEKEELLYGLVSEPYEERDYHLIKKNLKTGEQTELAKGINPAWSLDGTQIAYIGMDGLYVLRMDETAPKQLFKTQFFDPWEGGSPWILAPQPRWSPDGAWILYHQCINERCEVKQTPIYKVQVSDGTQVKIFTGGKFPTWHP